MADANNENRDSLKCPRCVINLGTLINYNGQLIGIQFNTTTMKSGAGFAHSQNGDGEELPRSDATNLSGECRRAERLEMVQRAERTDVRDVLGDGWNDPQAG